jgi:hypothetical protein
VTGCTNSPQKLFVNKTPITKSQANGCPSPVTNLGAGKWCYASGTVYLRKSDGMSPSADAVEVGSRTRGIDAYDDFKGNHAGWLTIDGLTIWGTEGYCHDREGALDLRWMVGGGHVTVKNTTFQYFGHGIWQTAGSDLVVDRCQFLDQGPGWTYPPLNGNAAEAIRTQNVKNISITNNIFARTGSHSAPLCDVACSNNVCPNGSGLCPNCARGPSGNYTAGCWIAGVSLQSANGAIVVTDNSFTDVEDGLNIKLDKDTPGPVISGGIERNYFAAWPHPIGTDPYQQSDQTIGLYCEHSGGPTNCAGVDGAGTTPYVSQFKIDRNELRGGFQGGIALSVLTNPGDPYAVRVSNNIVRAGDYLYGNAFEAAMRFIAGSTGIQVYNNTVQCEPNTRSGGAGLCIETGAAVDFRNNIFDFAGCSMKITDNSTSDTWNTTDNICDTAVAGRCSAGASTLVFVNEATANLRLAPGDVAAIDRGGTLTGFSNDIGGAPRPQASAWDIGAHEYGLTALPPPVLISVDPVP